jgi:hypothetical protein
VSARWRKRLKSLGIAIGVLTAFAVVAHLVVARATRIDPPQVSTPQGKVEHPTEGVRSFGHSHASKHGGIWLVELSGTPEQIGYAHSRLMYPEMVDNEAVLYQELDRHVPLWPLRRLLLDVAQVRYRQVDRGMSDARRQEIAAGARGFSPDPYADRFPTYQRFLYLNALYDISLSFEHSPLIGCTTFTLSGAAAADGHALLARNFDFEVDDVFDRDKAVFLVHEDGKIPFASVAWPGLVGVVSGMNAEGVAIVVHGGRAGEPTAYGEPVVHALRRVLSTARTSDEAVRALSEGKPMVSHIVIVTDRAGKAQVVERVPGRDQWVRALGERAAVTNHFEGPAAQDPKNLVVRAKTSTLPRAARGKELVEKLDHPATVKDAVAMLRDRRAAGGGELPLGDRRAIDAIIATHGVVFDTTAKELWVSEGPHLLGRFVRFSLEKGGGPVATIAADPLATSEEYRRFVRARGNSD